MKSSVNTENYVCRCLGKFSENPDGCYRTGFFKVFSYIIQLGMKICDKVMQLIIILHNYIEISNEFGTIVRPLYT